MSGCDSPSNMDLSRLMLHVQQVEDRRKKSGIRDARRPKPHDQTSPSNGGNKKILAAVSNLDSKRGNRVQGTLTFRGVHHLEEEDSSPRRAMEVICSLPERTMLIVVVLTMESADRALMPVLVAVRAGTWLRTVHRTGVRLEVMLILGLIHRVKQQLSFLRGTGSTP